MKKFIVISLVLVIALCSVSASVLQIGPRANFNGSLEDVPKIDGISQFSFGPDVRFNISIFSIQADALIGKNNTIWSFDTNVAACLRGQFSVFEIYGGVGASYTFFAGEGAPKFEFDTVGETLKNTLFAKVGLGFDFGFLGLLLDYKVPFVLFEATKDAGAKALLNGSLGLAMVFNIF